MLLGGMNWLTASSDDDTYTLPLVAAVVSGRLPEGRLRESAAHLLSAIAKLAGAAASTTALAESDDERMPETSAAPTSAAG